MSLMFGKYGPIKDETESYNDGWITGQNWDDVKCPWTPGGPFVYHVWGFNSTDKDWIAFCNQSDLNNKAWCQAWRDASNTRRMKENKS